MVAREGHDYGLPEDVVLELMVEHYNPRCEGPWTDGELETIVANAYRYAKRPQGCLHIEHAIRRFAGVKKSVRNWPEPEDLKTELLPVPPLPEDLIPESLRGWVKDIAHRMQVPLSFTAASAFVVAASLIGTGCGIKPKEKDDWLVVPNLWGGIVAKPGKLKSPALEAIIKPLAKLETEEMGLHNLALAAYESKQKEFANRKKVLEDMMKKAIEHEEQTKK